MSSAYQNELKNLDKISNMQNMLNLSLIDMIIPDIKSNKNENVIKMLDIVKDKPDAYLNLLLVSIIHRNKKIVELILEKYFTTEITNPYINAQFLHNAILPENSTNKLKDSKNNYIEEICPFAIMAGIGGDIGVFKILFSKNLINIYNINNSGIIGLSKKYKNAINSNIVGACAYYGNDKLLEYILKNYRTEIDININTEEKKSKNSKFHFLKEFTGFTPALLAVGGLANDNKTVEILKILEEYKANFENKDFNENNIIHIATKENKIKSLKLLIESFNLKDIINESNNDNLMPYTIAQKSKNKKMIEFFSQYMEEDEEKIKKNLEELVIEDTKRKNKKKIKKDKNKNNLHLLNSIEYQETLNFEEKPKENLIEENDEINNNNDIEENNYEEEKDEEEEKEEENEEYIENNYYKEDKDKSQSYKNKKTKNKKYFENNNNYKNEKFNKYNNNYNYNYENNKERYNNNNNNYKYNFNYNFNNINIHYNYNYNSRNNNFNYNNYENNYQNKNIYEYNNNYNYYYNNKGNWEYKKNQKNFYNNYNNKEKYINNNKNSIAVEINENINENRDIEENVNNNDNMDINVNLKNRQNNENFSEKNNYIPEENNISIKEEKVPQKLEEGELEEEEDEGSYSDEDFLSRSSEKDKKENKEQNEETLRIIEYNKLYEKYFELERKVDNLEKENMELNKCLNKKYLEHKINIPNNEENINSLLKITNDELEKKDKIINELKKEAKMADLSDIKNFQKDKLKEYKNLYTKNLKIINDILKNIEK